MRRLLLSARALTACSARRRPSGRGRARLLLSALVLTGGPARRRPSGRGRARLLLSALVLTACSGQPATRPAPALPEAPAPPAAAPPAPAAAPAPDPFAALNLGFEDVDGALPRGWTGRDAGALAAVTDEKHGGARALRVRAADGAYRSASARIDAAPLAGKHVRLRGWIKAEQVGEGAVLWLRAEGGGLPVNAAADLRREDHARPPAAVEAVPGLTRLARPRCPGRAAIEPIATFTWRRVNMDARPQCPG